LPRWIDVLLRDQNRSIRHHGDWGMKGTMSSIAERLLEDLGTAMRSKDLTRRDALRYLRSEVHNAEIESRRALTDQEIESLIQSQIRQRRESVEQFEKGKRQDLVDAENAQIAILQEYLPPQLDADELDRIAGDLAARLELSGARDMGKLMGPLREEVGSRAEGKAIAEAAQRALAQRERNGAGS
jgi:uncharacterized protein